MSDPTDIVEIKQLKARYCRFVDGKSWDEFRSLFVDDAVIELEPNVGTLVSFASADGCVPGIARFFKPGAVTTHRCYMPEIELTGATTARGIWAMDDYVDRISSRARVREAFRGYGHYLEEYRKEDGRWKIASLRLKRVRVDHLDRASLPPFPDPA